MGLYANECEEICHSAINMLDKHGILVTLRSHAQLIVSVVSLTRLMTMLIT